MTSTNTIESTLVDLGYPRLGPSLSSSWFSGGKRVSYAKPKVHAWKPVRRQVAMASLKIKRAQNVDGEFFVGNQAVCSTFSLNIVFGCTIFQFQLHSFVTHPWATVLFHFFADHSCIDCDTCRWMAPDIFKRTGEMSAVFKQPTSGQERLKALQALLSCPTSSIHTENPAPDILDAQKTFPMAIDEEKIPGVYHCGYHSKDSFGAASYLIVHPEGNILIDSPRYTERLASNIEKLGGARYMFLTHKDDVADHVKWSKRLSCDRILHFKDVEVSTADVETKLEGNGPWSLGKDIELIHVPGHSEGSVCLFYKPMKILFTGDHLLMTEQGLSISERYNYFSVPVQLDSVMKLLELDFEWVIPGHGRRVNFKDSQEKNSILEAFVQEKYSWYAPLTPQRK